MKVKIEYKNKKLDTVGYDEFDFDIYCQKLSQDITRLLTDIERFFQEQNIKNEIESNDFYRNIRHRLLDLAGSIKRLPDNIIDNVKNDQLYDENIDSDNKNKKKITISSLLKLFE